MQSATISKVTYSDFSNAEFQNAMMKVTSAHTDAATACHIRKFIPVMKDTQKKINEEYRALVIKFAEKDEKGEMVRPDGPDSFKIATENEESFKKAMEEFSKTEVIVDYRPLDMNTIRDVKISAREIDALKGFFSDGIVDAGENVVSLR